MATLKLELAVEEVQGILNALGAQSFNQVAGLIGKIREQAMPQVQELEAQAMAASQKTEEKTLEKA